MPASNKASEFFVKIGGTSVSEQFMRDLLSIVVDTDLHQPDMFTITLHDDELRWVDEGMLAPGNPVEISAQAAQQGGRTGEEGPLFKGEITNLEPDFDATGRSVMVVRGYDRSHRLHRGRKRRSFSEMTDSDIVAKVAQEAGLSAEVDATSVTHEYVFQNNQTNFEFVRSRARRIGYQVYVDNKTLYFKKGNKVRGAGPELTWGETLRTFRPRLSATHQADTVTVQGWDPQAKQAIVGSATKGHSAPEIGAGTDGGKFAKKAFGGAAESVLVSHPVATKDEADGIAQAVYDELCGEFVEAEGLCFGDPRILAGYTVEISSVGSRFSGTYVVTSATHVFDQNGYETSFEVSGRHPYTLTHLLDQPNGHHEFDFLYPGVVVGLVTNNNDEKGFGGRVKVKFPWINDEDESAWARIAAPMAGKDRGFFYLPEVNDEVLIAFEHGDIHRPYVVGVLWNGKDTPPAKTNEVVKQGKVNQRILKSRSGHLIVLDDTQGQENIIVRDKTGKNEVIIDSKQNTMTINVQKDYSLDAKGNVTNTAGGNVTVDAKGNVSVKSKANVTVEAAGNMTVKANGNLNIQATGMLDIKGSKVSIQGSGMAELKSGGVTQIQGSMVKLN